MSAFARRSRGFTFIELMMAVGLLALLLTITLPSYFRYHEKARQRLAASEITTMAANIKLRWQDDRAYPGTLADTGYGQRLDPWGRPYVYYNVEANGRGGARKDHALNPINTDFDLYSLGPDGATKPQVTQKDSLDDVIRANNGGFVGTAADF